MKFFIESGSREHRNYFQEIIEQFFPRTTFGIFEVNAHILDRRPVRGRAKEREATAMVCEENGNLRHLSLHHNDNNALLLNVGADRALAEKVFLCSDKHNACPLILIRNKQAGEQATIMWHLSYSDLNPPHGTAQNMITHLPKHLREKSLINFQSLRDAFTNPNAEILVTNHALLNQEVLAAAGQRKMLTLPSDLHLVSSVIEGQIRSYSANYFPVEDKLILAGDDVNDEPYLWLMNEPFSSEASWQKISVTQLKEYADSKDEPGSLFDCIQEFLHKNSIDNNLNSGPK